jgi:hypothetical protein
VGYNGAVGYFGAHALYVFGHFDYTDVFGRLRSTEYRQRLGPSNGGIDDKEDLITESSAGNRTF